MFACDPQEYPSISLDTDGSQRLGVAPDGLARMGTHTCAAGGHCSNGTVRLSGAWPVDRAGYARGWAVSGTPEVLGIDGTWSPVCGHYFWGSDRGAELMCQEMGYAGGSLNSTAPREAYSTDAMKIGACTAGDGDFMACTGEARLDTAVLCVCLGLYWSLTDGLVVENFRWLQ